MFDTVISALTECIQYSFHLLTVFLQKIPGSAQFIIGMFVVFLSYRFFLVPLVHGDVFSMASERASRSREGDAYGHINGKAYYKSDVKRGTR